MEKLTFYRDAIEKILTEYRDRVSSAGVEEVENCLSFDEVRDHYFWFRVGWEGKRRVSQIAVYIRLKNGKIWIEEDWTERGIATDLLEAGISPEEIVLGFHHPSKRFLTEFATA